MSEGLPWWGELVIVTVCFILVAIASVVALTLYEMRHRPEDINDSGDAGVPLLPHRGDESRVRDSGDTRHVSIVGSDSIQLHEPRESDSTATTPHRGTVVEDSPPSATTKPRPPSKSFSFNEEVTSIESGEVRPPEASFTTEFRRKRTLSSNKQHSSASLALDDDDDSIL
eukprot:GILI01020986.1.p1 GENE.GILI01020986.1~~GILI01020986.1.p1  ORF type:complete len:170 (-),score=13.37 GILI01020986.1:470-979(-)